MAPLTIRVKDATRPLEEIARALHRRFKKVGIHAVGIGRRRLEKKNRLTGEITLKVVLAEKPRGRIPRSRRIPRRITILTTLLGQPVRFRLPVDLEAAQEAVPTYHHLKVPGGVLTVGCYVRWVDPEGVARIGALTAAHGFWQQGELLKEVAMESADSFPGHLRKVDVVCGSHLRDDGVDVGLVRFRVKSDAEFR